MPFREKLKGGLRDRRLHQILVVAFAFVAITLLLSYKWLPLDVVPLAVGDPAPRDIEAPRNLEIVDEKATKETRDGVGLKAPTVFTQRDVVPEIDAALKNTLRTLPLMKGMDPKMREERARELPIQLSPQSIDTLARVPEQFGDIYRVVHMALVEVLRDKVGEAQMEEARTRLATIISDKPLSSPAVKTAAIELAQHALKANSVADWEATVKKQQEAMAHVEPIVRHVQKGQNIVRKGDIVTPMQLETLDALGLHRQTINVYGVLANALFVCLMIFVVAIYLAQQDPPTVQEPRSLWLLTLLCVSVLGISRAGVAYSPYLTPVATASLLMGILLDYRLALIVTSFLGMCIGIMTTGVVTSDLSPCIAATITGMVAVLSVTNVARRGDLMISTLVVWLVNVMSVLVVCLWSNESLSTLTRDALFFASLNGLTASVLAIGALPFLENIFNVTTHIKLLELSNHTSEPLLQRLMTEAPGTYHHSMIVANLAESAARAIGADPLLAKVGAFYHDIGKMKAAHFFVENQLGQENPHDRLTPSLSAHIIISHVQDGMEMARAARLPQVVADFIDMHHGDRLVSYFYHKALQRGESAEEKDFRYHGRRPRTKETAIVMTADTIEAKARLLAKPTQESLDNMVRESLRVIIDDGQLNDSNLSLRDIERISQAFVRTLMSIYHSRIEYPKDIGSVEKKPKESLPTPTV